MEALRLAALGHKVIHKQLEKEAPTMPEIVHIEVDPEVRRAVLDRLDDLMQDMTDLGLDGHADTLRWMYAHVDELTRRPE